MPMRHPTSAELDRWDDLIASNPGGGSMWQFDTYATFKEPVWQPIRAVHELADGTTIYATYLQRRIRGLGALWYASCGPRVTNAEHFAAVCEQLRGLRRPFAIIMEPPIEVSGPDEAQQIAASIERLQVTDDVQMIAQHTTLIDLRPSEDELLASFKQRTRRYIRKSQDVRIDFVADSSAFEPMQVLYRQMLQRAHLDERPKGYLESQWQLYLDRDEGTFIFATPAGQDEPVAGAFIMQHEDVGLYKDGGSTRDPAANGVQYRVQWEAMRWCKQRGARTYDMFGAPPSWQLDDPNHQFHGLVQFKSGFGGFTDYAGAFALVFSRPRWDFWERYGLRAYRKFILPPRVYFY